MFCKSNADCLHLFFVDQVVMKLAHSSHFNHLTSTLACRFYKNIKLILRRIKFNFLEPPPTTDPVFHVDPWKNKFSTPVLEQHTLASRQQNAWCILNYIWILISHWPYVASLEQWKGRQIWPRGCTIPMSILAHRGMFDCFFRIL